MQILAKLKINFFLIVSVRLFQQKLWFVCHGRSINGYFVKRKFRDKCSKMGYGWFEFDEAANLGQVFIAVDPNCFAPGFENQMSEMNGILRNLPPVRSQK